MDDKDRKETVNGYEIQRSIRFENNRGFALAEDTNAPDPFVTWQFTEDENGARDYFWGHYAGNKDTATRDYESRVDSYHKDNEIFCTDGYLYYSTQRPVDIGTFPKTGNGPVIIFNFDAREDVVRENFKAWGYLVYDAPLTEKQMDDYELRAAYDNPDVVKRMREQAQTVGHWEEMKGLPENERYTWHRPSIGVFEMCSPRVSPEQMAKRFDYAKQDLTRLKKIENQVQIVGIWEDRQKTPEAERFTWYQPSIHAFALQEPAVSLEVLERRFDRAIKDISRSIEKRPAPKPIAEQLAEANKQMERGADAPAKKNDKSHEDR